MSSEYPFRENLDLSNSPNPGLESESIAFLPKNRLRSPKTATIPWLFCGQIPPQYSPEPKPPTCGLATRSRISLYPENHPLHDKFEGPKCAPSAKLQVP
jgi:hypothetical protein